MLFNLRNAFPTVEEICAVKESDSNEKQKAQSQYLLIMEKGKI